MKSFFSRTSLFSKPLKKSKKTFYENILGNQSCLVSSIVSKLLNIYFCKIPILFNCSIPRLKVILPHEEAVLFFEWSSKPRLFYEKRARFVPFSSSLFLERAAFGTKKICSSALFCLKSRIEKILSCSPTNIEH